MTPMDTVTHAVQLAERGFATFPCLLNKAPACPHGFKDASIDAGIIRLLWQRYPGELVGIATGAISDLAVLDIDAHAEAHAWWKAHRNALPVTWTVRTRSGGLHLWYRNAIHLRCTAGAIAPGIDVRAAGGYIIAWHVAGFPVLREAHLVSWPDWLCPPAATPTSRANETPRVPDDKQTAALVRFVALAPEHQRNNRLFWAACRMASMVASQLLSAGEAEAVLVQAAIYAGLPDAEARRTTRSGFATVGAG
jgi:hypothetical protein